MSLVFVTGASGQIGVPLVRALVQAGHRVRGLCRSDEAEARLKALGVETARGDLRDTVALELALKGVEVVYHLAGGLRGKGQETAHKLNRDGTAALIAAAHGKPLKKLIFASTCAVYGDRNGLWVGEDYPPSPHTDYGKSKVEAENLLLSSGLPVTIARIGVVYGRGFRVLMEEAHKKGRAWLPGEGLNFLPWVHVDDVVGALLRIGERGQLGEIYHVVGKSTPSLKDFYKEVAKKLGTKPVRFWSTWVPSALQFRLAEANEKLAGHTNRKPRFTPDNLRLWTAGVRMRSDRLEKELGYVWRFGDYREGLAESLG
jgi:nucleoside-diphosphate-sugar epimerase